ncbi:MAG: zinc-ribbon domain-containing protein [Saccharofermentans sp.]|nr:zinc-ribbon domain-containing protein [Saccharofermentans sp.]
MSYCSQCGKLLSDDDVYCSKCGLPVAEDRKMSENEEQIRAMSVEESIAYAKEISSQYEEIHKIKTAISDCEADIRKYKPSDKKVRYSAFRFFWPSLIIALVAFWIVVLTGFVISLYTYSEGTLLIFEFIGLLVIAGILLIGGSKAQKKRDSLNYSISEEEYRRKKKYTDKQRELETLENRLKKAKASAADFDRIVPVPMRNRSKMEIVIDLLERGRAGTIEEAMDICKTVK